MKLLIALALLCGAAPASAQAVEAATGNWNYLPFLKRAGTGTVSAIAVTRIHELVALGKCDLPGQSDEKLDLDVSFAVRYTPEGAVERVIIPKYGCSELEGILGGQVLALLEAGDFKPTGENDDGWYQGVLKFESYGSPI